jgi:hypothetical protein
MQLKLTSIMVAVGALLATLISTATLADEPRHLTFLGETYAVAHRDVRESGNSLIELIRAGDALESWRQLLAVHRFPDNAETPREAVLTFAGILRKIDPETRFGIVENPATGEAIIDFLAPPGSGEETVELNAFKYARHPSGKGLVALQFARRFRLGEVTGSELRQTREAAVDAAAAFDMRAAHTLFPD